METVDTSSETGRTALLPPSKIACNTQLITKSQQMRPAYLRNHVVREYKVQDRLQHNLNRTKRLRPINAMQCCKPTQQCR